jgi:hypothetical protein
MSLARSLALPFLLLLSSSHLWASPDAPPVGTRFGKDINVAAGQNVQDDLTCFSCSIYIQGNVAGDVTAFKGKIVIEGPAQVAGDVTTIVGDVVVGPETKIAGDVTAVGGGIQRAPLFFPGQTILSRSKVRRVHSLWASRASLTHNSSIMAFAARNADSL